MRLIACSVCHTQYDTSQLEVEHFDCRCGERLANHALRAQDAVIARCGSCGAAVAGEDDEACSFCGSAIVRDPDKLSLICPECFARNADESRFCVACGVAFRPEPVPGEGRELPCPACGGSMPPSAVAGIGLNECPGCHGLWVPGEHFDALLRRAAEAQAARPPTAEPPRVTGANPARQELRYRRCPECEHWMQRVNYRRSSGVILDQCRAHGTWLDADELEQVAGFILSGGRTSPVIAQEHDQARAAAAAAFARARVQHQAARPVEPGRSTFRLLDLLVDILT